MFRLWHHNKVLHPRQSISRNHHQNPLRSLTLEEREAHKDFYIYFLISFISLLFIFMHFYFLWSRYIFPSHVHLCSHSKDMLGPMPRHLLFLFIRPYAYKNQHALTIWEISYYDITELSEKRIHLTWSHLYCAKILAPKLFESISLWRQLLPLYFSIRST